MRILGVALPYLLLVVPHIYFVPLWDGAIYAEVVLRAAGAKFDIWTLNHADHPGIGSLLIPALFVKATGGQLWGLQLGSIVLGVFGIIGFLSIVDALFREISRLERSFIALTFSSMPVYAATTLNTNLDFGTLVFFLLFLASLLHQRFYAAAVFGGMLLLAKEAGIVVWVATIIAYSTAVILRREGAPSEKIRKMIRMTPAFFGILALVAYIVVRMKNKQGLIWASAASQDKGLVEQMTSFSLLDPVFKAYLALIFSVNFMWIPTLFIATGVVAWMARSLINAQPRNFAMRRELIVLLTVTLLLVLTRFRTFANIRYFLPIFPALLLAFAHAMQGLVPSPLKRVGIFGLTTILFLTSAIRTIDPVSRRIFGTFVFGEHPILSITSITNECCGKGRDQLVYNLEFVLFDELINRAFSDVRPTESQPIVVPDAANWWLVSPMTAADPPRRTIQGRPSRQTPMISAREVVARAAPPERLFWLGMPLVDGSGEVELLKMRYEIIDRKFYEKDGYSLSGLVMARKSNVEPQ
jgi:hypothetical protein